MEGLILRVLDSTAMCRILKAISICSVLSSIVAFFATVTVVFINSYTDALLLLAASALSFLILTLLRLVINRRRPYEVYKSLKAPIGAHRGLSFPSRHIFSIFYIAVIFSYVSTALSVILAFMGILLAVCRVLLGIHFVSDTLVGALIGILLSILSLILIYNV